MKNQQLLENGFQQLCVEKSLLERAQMVSNDKVFHYLFNSTNNNLNDYHLYANDKMVPDPNVALSFNDDQYTLTFEKGVYNACVFPVYNDDHLTRNLRRNGLTLHKVQDFPYILFGNPTKDATIIISNTSKYDFLSSHILDGLLDCIVDKGLASLDHCIVVIPNVNLGLLDINDILEKYQYPNTKFIEIEGSFKVKSHMLENHDDESFSYTPALKANSVKISPNLSDDRVTSSKTIKKRNQKHLRVLASYWKLNPADAKEFGYEIAQSVLR